MSLQYDRYLNEHISNVLEAYEYIKRYISDILPTSQNVMKNLEENIKKHDETKRSDYEYDAYDKYFYSNNVSSEIVNNFDIACLHHYNHNPHHWQYWILMQDDHSIIAMEMPSEYVIEMICDWWSFSFKTRELAGIIEWYNDNKNKMLLHDKTRSSVEYILKRIGETIF